MLLDKQEVLLTKVVIIPMNLGLNKVDKGGHCLMIFTSIPLN
jgi:hypothetical protein